MSRFNDGYIELTAKEFINFLEGNSRNDSYLGKFYSSKGNIFPSISASRIKVTEEIRIDTTEEFIFDIHLSDSIFEKEVTIVGAVFNQLWFSQCQFLNRVRIYNGNFKSWLWFTGCDLENSFTISNGVFKSCHFTSNSIKGFFLIEGGKFDQVEISQTDESKEATINGPFTLINYLSIVGGTAKSTLSINDCIINILKYSGVFNKGSILVNADLKLYALIFDKVVNLGVFNISNIEVLKQINDLANLDTDLLFGSGFVFEEYTEDRIKRAIEARSTRSVLEYVNHYGNRSNKFIKANLVRLKQILFIEVGTEYENIFIQQKMSELSLFASSIGELEIKNLNVGSFQIVRIDSSDLSSLKTMNTKFPVKKGSVLSRSNQPKNLYHFYNDLYSMASKQNNLKDKIDYYKASQTYLLEDIKIEKFSLKKLSSIWSIKTSSFFSDFGQNSIRAFLVVVCFIGPLFFGAFLISLENVKLDLSISGIRYFVGNFLPYYPEFLNPTHKSTFLSDISPLGSFSRTIDLVARIFVGIGVYEMIRSFRKFVRK